MFFIGGNKMKKLILKFLQIPLVTSGVKRAYGLIFPGSIDYWEERYKSGGISGAGSYGDLAVFKAETLNDFVIKHQIKSVIEFGCGDSNQLSLFQLPSYIGFDVSPAAIKKCKERFFEDKTKSFFLYDSTCFVDNHNIFNADLTISLDVIYHLVEDVIFHEYMSQLFNASSKYVAIYSSNHEQGQNRHEKDREFTKWIERNEPNWRLLKIIENKYPYDPNNPESTSKSDFYFYEKS